MWKAVLKKAMINDQAGVSNSCAWGGMRWKNKHHQSFFFCVRILKKNSILFSTQLHANAIRASLSSAPQLRSFFRQWTCTEDDLCPLAFFNFFFARCSLSRHSMDFLSWGDWKCSGLQHLSEKYITKTIIYSCFSGFCRKCWSMIWVEILWSLIKSSPRFACKKTESTIGIRSQFWDQKCDAAEEQFSKHACTVVGFQNASIGDSKFVSLSHWDKCVCLCGLVFRKLNSFWRWGLNMPITVLCHESCIINFV